MSPTDNDRAGDIGEFERLKNESDPRSIAEMKAGDEWQEGPITSVHDRRDDDGRRVTVEWTVAREWAGGGVIERGSHGTLGASFRLPEGRSLPTEGDTVRFYGRGLGSAFHGVDVNGREVFYRTPYERLAERVRWLAQYDREQRERFVEQKDELDRRVEELPPPLKARIERFRAESPTFRQEAEAYEMAAAGDAPKIARALAAEQGWFLDDNLCALIVDQGSSRARAEDVQEAVKGFYEADYAEQQRRVPDLDPGHSGNTFGGAVGLARALLQGKPV